VVQGPTATPLDPVAKQKVVVGQDTASSGFPLSTLFADHVGDALLGLSDVITVPGPDTTVHELVLGQDTANRMPKSGWLVRIHADAPPGGSVDVKMFPAASTDTKLCRSTGNRGDLRARRQRDGSPCGAPPGGICRRHHAARIALRRRFTDHTKLRPGTRHGCPTLNAADVRDGPGRCATSRIGRREHVASVVNGGTEP
jgi:hypothetical protein